MIAALRAVPLFVEHKLCAGCRTNSWRAKRVRALPCLHPTRLHG